MQIPKHLALAALLLATTAAEASAQWLYPRSYQSERTTRGPQRGYSGWTGIGTHQLYCDYQRVPNRSCTIDRSGRERCRITSWTLKQFCY